MKCVDLRLNPAPEPSDWKDFEKAKFICTECLTTLPSKSDELFFFPEVDYFFHKHPDRSFYRVLLLTDKGNVRIGMGESESDNVLQLLCIDLDGLGDYKKRLKSLDEIQNASKKFFKAMREQKRKIEKKSTIYLR